MTGSDDSAMMAPANRGGFVSDLIHQYRAGNGPAAALLVHGRRGNVDSMAIFAAQAPQSMHLLSVQAPWEEAPGEFSWWRAEAGAERDRACSLLEDFIAAARPRYDLQEARLIGCGFSQGAALISLLVQRRPGLFSGAALLCGFVVQEPGGPALPGTPLLIVHGLRDSMIPVRAAREGAHHLERRGARTVLIEDNTGHKVGRAGMAALRRWLEERALP